MKKILLIMIFASLVSVAVLREISEGFGECAQDCQTCHKIVKSEASCLLDCVDLKDDNIKDISMVPSAGLWKVEVEKDGKLSSYFIDFGKKNVFIGEMRPATLHESHSNPEWEGNDSDFLLNNNQIDELIDMQKGSVPNNPE